MTRGGSRAISRAILIWLLGLAVAIGLISRTSVTTDMSAFLPSSPDLTQQVLVDQLRDGVASRLILLAIEGATEKVRAEISRRMADDLRKNDDFVSVDDGGGVGANDQAYVWRNRYLLSPAVTPERYSEQGLREALQQDLRLLSSGLSPLLKESIAHDPTNETMAIAGTIAGDARRKLRDGVWISPDGSRALLLLRTRAPGFVIDAQEKALTAINTAFDRSRRDLGDSDARLLATGPGLFAVKTRAGMKHDVTLYSTIAVAAIIGLLLAAYRSPLVVVLTMVPVTSGALAGLAAVGLWFGAVHGITIGFGVTLIGEAVDYAVYLFTRTRAGGDPQATLQRIWPTLRLGVLVSICGFAAMLFSSFTGFAQLGVFTVVGLSIALCVTRFVLPNLMPAGFAGTRDIAFAPALLRLVHHARRLRLPLFLGVAAALALIAWRGNDLWQDEIASMSPVSETDQRLDRDLRRDMGAPDVRHIVVLTAADRETALRTSESASALLAQLTAAGALSGYETPDRILPSEATQQARKDALPVRSTLERNLNGALHGLPFRPETFAPFLDDIGAAREAGPLTRESLAGTALSLKLDSQLIERNGRWIAVIPLRGVADPQPIAEAMTGLDGKAISVKLLDLKAESDGLLHRYRHEALLLASLGSLVIAALLLLHFRSARQSLVVLAPLGVAVVLTVALLVGLHHQLSIFNLFGLLLVVAVGSNYCLFFQRGGMEGAEGARTVTSLLLANICTVIGFGALSMSRIPVLYGIGSTVALGTALSLIAAAILTPSRNLAGMPPR